MQHETHPVSGQLPATPTKRLDKLAKRIGRLKEGMDLLTPRTPADRLVTRGMQARAPIDRKPKRSDFKSLDDVEATVANLRHTRQRRKEQFWTEINQWSAGRRGGLGRRHSTSSSDASRGRGNRPRGRSFDMAWDTSSKELVPTPSGRHLVEAGPDDRKQESSSSNKVRQRRLKRTKSQPILLDKPFHSSGAKFDTSYLELQRAPEGDSYTREWNLDFPTLFAKHRVKKTGLVDLHAFIQAAQEAIKENLEDDDLRKAFFRYAKNYLDAGSVSDDSKVLNATDFMYSMTELRNAAIFRSLDSKRTGYLTSHEVVEGARRALRGLGGGERTDIIRQIGDHMIDIGGFNRILDSLEMNRDAGGKLGSGIDRLQNNIIYKDNPIPRPSLPAAKIDKQLDESFPVVSPTDISGTRLITQLSDLHDKLEHLKGREQKVIKPTKMRPASTRDKSTQTNLGNGETTSLVELRLETQLAYANRLEKKLHTKAVENRDLSTENSLLRRQVGRIVVHNKTSRGVSRPKKKRNERKSSKRKKAKKRRRLSPKRTNLALRRLAGNFASKTSRELSKTQITKRVKELNGSLRTMEKMIRGRHNLSRKEAHKTRRFVGELACAVEKLRDHIKAFRRRASQHYIQMHIPDKALICTG